MKKIFNIFLIFCLVFSVFFVPIIGVKAESISSLREKLAAIEKKEKDNSDKIKQTESQIARTRSEIANIYTDMANISNEIIAKEAEIVELNNTISMKDAETKELMKSLQMTTGDSFYLEYIFGADSITDFIYRYSITEQLTKYNSKLIDEMNSAIETNIKRKDELARKQVELTDKQSYLSVQLQSLNSSKVRLYENERAIADEIANARSVIQMYKDAGCGEYEDINICANRLLPPDTKFFRPLSTGYVTSEYGYRLGPTTGVYGIHEGIDISNQFGLNSKIYSAANGLVVKIFYDKWGGNQIVIHHNIGGVKYSSSYAHLSQILVRDGQTVTRDTVIGMMGSTGSSTGPHLHIAISKGLRYKDYIYYYDYVARCINPRSVINFPTAGRWNDRITKYN